MLVRLKTINGDGDVDFVGVLLRVVIVWFFKFLVLVSVWFFKFLVGFFLSFWFW